MRSAASPARPLRRSSPAWTRRWAFVLAADRRRMVVGVTSAVAGLLSAAYAVTLLPGVRPTPGYSPVLDGWVNGIVDGSVIVAVVARSALHRRERAAWLLFVAGLLTALAASIGYYAHYQHLADPPDVSFSDIGWIAFYVFLYAGVLMRLRSRLQQMLRSLWLDGAIAGLTAAALAVAYLGLTSGTGGLLDAGLVGLYPVADVLLLAVVVAVIAVLGRAADGSWLLLCASFVTFAATDAVYADQVATGTYESGGALDIGWVLARALLVAAAWTSARHPVGEPVRAAGAGLFAVPAVCGSVVLLVLFHGSTRPLPTTAMALALAAGLATVFRAVLSFEEVRHLAEARRLLRLDDLTGLASRRHFHRALERAATHAGERPSALISLDLNGFKEINDTLGHEAGDEVLRVVGRRLALHGRANDVVSRLGGDEFAILLVGASLEEAGRIATEVRDALRRPMDVCAASLAVDASLGVAHLPTHTGDGATLLRMADLAMYAAKRLRHGIDVFDPGRHGEEVNRLERVAELRDALDTEQIFLEFQPQVDVRSGRTTGVEALVRWRHPERGLLPPLAFIALAESAGLIRALTRTVLDRALRQQRAWADDGLRLRMAVNVSPSVLSDPTFAHEVACLLSAHVVDGTSLTLELTEELVVSERDAALLSMERLRQLGVQLSIDDYGTGYASLGYLKDLPVQEVKLDKSFVADMATSAASTAIVRSTIDLAHALGLTVVAEGVEDAVTMRMLRQAGADQLQGYFLSRPVPADRLPDAVIAAASGELVRAG